jgi:hypothetical protein
VRVEPRTEQDREPVNDVGCFIEPGSRIGRAPPPTQPRRTPTRRRALALITSDVNLDGPGIRHEGEPTRQKGTR